MSSHHIHIAAAVIINSAHKTLLVRKRGTAAFMQAGGKIDGGETASQALLRELSEELGILAGDAALAPLGTFEAAAANEPGHRVVAELFVLHSDAPMQPAREIEEIVWVDPADADNLPLAPLTRETALPLASKNMNR
ncbi:MAG: NUDIX domain-containing protein [Pseudomonadota bacterium]